MPYEIKKKSKVLIKCKNNEITEGSIPWVIGHETVVNLRLVINIEEMKVHLRNFDKMKLNSELDKRNLLRIEVEPKG